MVLGEEGMALLQYVGAHRGIIAGPCTRHPYNAVPGSEASYVDARDAEGLLKMRDEDGRTIFKEGSW